MSSGVALVLAMTVLPAVYFGPTLVGALRRVDDLPLVFMLNVIGGLTGVGWLGAMILAFGPRRMVKPPVHCLGDLGRWDADPALFDACPAGTRRASGTAGLRLFRLSRPGWAGRTQRWVS